MKLKNLIDVYIYEPISIKNDGETYLKWKYKYKKRLNVQQDIGELDVNSAGLIDFDKIKIRLDYDLDIKKQDGISLKKLSLNEDLYAKESPKYRVTTKTKIGKTIICSCEIYHGE